MNSIESPREFASLLRTPCLHERLVCRIREHLFKKNNRICSRNKKLNAFVLLIASAVVVTANIYNVSFGTVCI